MKHQVHEIYSLPKSKTSPYGKQLILKISKEAEISRILYIQ